MSIWGPVAVSVLLTYMISSLFLGIFENAVLALMTCLAVDKDLHDGEPKYGPATFHDSIEKVKKHGDPADVGDSDEEEQKGNSMK